MSVSYKVWIEIEEYDDKKDTYTNDCTPTPVGEFKTREAAEALVSSLETVATVDGYINEVI